MSYSLAFSKAIITVLFVGDKVRQGMYEFVPAKVISAALNIPGPTLVKILQNLHKAGIVETREGAKGGVRLAVPPAKITFFDIFSAIESGRPLFRMDLNLNVSGSKPTRGQQAILGVLKRAEDSMKESLKTVTIEEILQQLEK